MGAGAQFTTLYFLHAYEWAQRARVFVRSLPKSGAPERCFIQLFLYKNIKLEDRGCIHKILFYL